MIVLAAWATVAVAVGVAALGWAWALDRKAEAEWRRAELAWSGGEDVVTALRRAPGRHRARERDA